MNFTRSDYMRERLSDLSEDACDRLYHAIENGHWMEVGRIIDKECAQEIKEHFQENMVREIDNLIHDDEAA